MSQDTLDLAYRAADAKVRYFDRDAADLQRR